MTTSRDVPRWLPLALLILALLALFHRLLADETLFWGLPALQFYPWRQFAFEELSAGRLPAWNPYLGAGAPLLANYQTAVFYPPNWLWLILPGPQAMSWIAVLHVLWTGLGMWLFAAALGLPAFGRGISALAFALSGYLIARLGSFPTANAGAWLPWLFWLAHRVLAQRRWRDAGWLALAFAMQLLTGHAQTTFYGAVGLGLYALWTAWREVPRERRIFGLARAGTAIALGVALAAIQLIPTAEYLRESQRSGGLDYETLTNYSYHPLRLFTLLSPNFFGTPADGSYLGEGNYFEDAAYIGFIPFISALAAIVGWLRQRRHPPDSAAFATIPFWAGLALVGFFFALGKYNPAFPFLYDRVPTFDTFRDPARWLILTVFGLSVLAGIGTQHWGRGRWIVFWSRLAAAGGGGMAIMALVALEFMELDSENLRVLSEGMMVLGLWTAGAALLTLTQPMPPSPVSPFLWRIAVLVFVTIDLAWMASGLNPTVPTGFFGVTENTATPGRTYWSEDYAHDVTFGSSEDNGIQGYFDLSDYRRATENWREVRASGLPNLNMLDRAPSFSNNDPLLSGHYSDYRDLIEDLGANSGDLLRAAGVTRVYGMTLDGWRGANPALALYEDNVTLAWLVPEAIWLDSDGAIKEALRDPAWNPAQSVILAGESAVEGGAPSLPSGEVIVLEDQPTRRRYRVTADGAGILVVAQTWYPGWSAQMDGQSAALYRANLAFQAVMVPPGEHDITLTYTIHHWRAGVGISALALVFVAGLLLSDNLRRLIRHD
jgi:hypothetical protein